VTAPGWPDGVGRIALARLDSTMDEAARRAGEIADRKSVV